jgi:hypothetical protein
MLLKRITLTFWRLFDPLYYACTRLRYVDDENNIFRVRLLCYRGQTLTLSDGTRIEKGDLLLKIHLHNVRLLRFLLPLHSNVIKARMLRSLVVESLPAIAQLLCKGEPYQDVKAIIGITQLNRACQSLGFDVQPISTTWYRVFKRFSLFPIYLLSAAQPVQSFRKLQPMMLFMSRKCLVARYYQSPPIS